MTMTSGQPSPLKSPAKQQKESLYLRRSNLRSPSARRTWRFHSPAGSLGASYQQSPTITSSLPSLLTSATPTPSERKVRSRTIFFQETLVFLPWPLAAKQWTNENTSAEASHQ